MAERKLPQPVTLEEYHKLIEEAKKDREKYRKKRSGKLTPRGVRVNEYIIAMVLGFGAGMRISEIVGYQGKTKRYMKDQAGKATSTLLPSNEIVIPKLEASRLENNMIRILSGKGKKDRLTYLPGKLFLKAGIQRKTLASSLPLKVSRRSIQLYTEELGMKALNKKISFHKLRHGFGTTLAGKGVPLHEIQMLMGHSRLDTTGIYLHANPQQALKNVEEVF